MCNSTSPSEKYIAVIPVNLKEMKPILKSPIPRWAKKPTACYDSSQLSYLIDFREIVQRGKTWKTPRPSANPIVQPPNIRDSTEDTRIDAESPGAYCQIAAGISSSRSWRGSSGPNSTTEGSSS